MKGETVITCMNWSKKESTYINKICLKIQKMKLHQLSLSLKKKKKRHYGLSFIWSLDLGALSAASRGISLSFSIEALSTGRVVEARSFSKLWEAAPGWRASATLFEKVPCGISGFLACSCWLERGGFWNWASSAGLVTGRVTSFWPGARPGACMAGGKNTFSSFLSSEEASIPARLSASS